MPEAAHAPLILASASPRRRELLGLTGLPFEVIPSAYDEPAQDWHDDPAAWACHLAAEKAREVARRYPGLVVIGADTVVALGTRMYAKPADQEDAVRILSELAGRPHRVFTGVTLIDGRGGHPVELSFATGTTVYFRALQEAEIRAYVACGEPMDKAGAYGIQGPGMLLVERIDGDYSNVVGLPLAPLALQLRKLGLPVLGV